jgi:hypothetical protein
METAAAFKQKSKIYERFLRIKQKWADVLGLDKKSAT